MNPESRNVMLSALLVLLAGCGNSLSGKYGDAKGVNLNFHSNGKVELDVLGPVQEASYVVEDGKVKISGVANAGTLILKIDDKGCLDGGMMLGKLCKQ
ncbi:MAG: hypothetical protein ABI460_02780 [Caldimonas sp.]